MCWQTAVLISYRTIQRSSSPESPHRKIPPGAPLLESVTPVHFEARCDGAAHGGDSPSGDCLLYATPVSALPQVDYPTIQILTFYPGASPDVVATTVTAPLERQFGQLQGL